MCECTCAPKKLQEGDVLHGYCGGVFGRDSYDCKRVEIIGSCWVVVQYGTGFGTPYEASGFARGFFQGKPDSLVQYTEKDTSEWADDCGCA